MMLDFLCTDHRLPWDTWSSPSWPVCTTMEQLTYHEMQYLHLGNFRESDLIKITGCSIPCKFREFKIVGTPKEVDHTNIGLQLSFAKTQIVEEKEALVYDFVSFVSEFGGALGLFLGFSFLTSWDLLEVCIAALYNRR